MSRKVTVILIAAYILLVIVFIYRHGSGLFLGLPTTILPLPAAAPGRSRHGAIASESDVCSNIGKTFLLQGGNAADALIGTALCLGVVAMYHVGIGGGGFMLIRSPNGKLETIEFKERAPAAAYENMFVGRQHAQWIGGLSVGVPGELRGLELLHKRHASLAWSRLVEPSVALARDGFRINKDLALYLSKPEQEFLRTDPSWAVDFAPNGTLKGLGEIMTRQRYAQTLMQIANHGVDDFFEGSIASSTIQAIRKSNGNMAIHDLKNYQANLVQPVQIKYRDFIITGDDLPAGGTQIMSVFKTLEGFEQIGEPHAFNLSAHYLVEATRFSWAERTRLGDPLFNDSIEPFARTMISERAARSRRSRISEAHTLDPDGYNSDDFGNAPTGGTSSMVAADDDGLVIAWTSTVNDWWGSRICVPETGIILNNIMGDFATPGVSDLWGLPPSPANFISGGKRPMDSISNIIVEHARNRTFFFATGCAGGAHIITTVIQMLWRVLDQRMSLNQAALQPRLHDQLHPNRLDVDWTFDNKTIAFMRSLGHNITYVSPGSSRPHSALPTIWSGTRP